MLILQKCHYFSSINTIYEEAGHLYLQTTSGQPDQYLGNIYYKYGYFTDMIEYFVGSTI